MHGIFKDIFLLLLGGGAAILGQRLLDWNKERRQKQHALKRLDRMLTDVRNAIDHGHDFRNKQDWFRELDELAN